MGKSHASQYANFGWLPEFATTIQHGDRGKIEYYNCILFQQFKNLTSYFLIL